MKKAAILGGGGWGTALSMLLHEKGVNVSVWEFDREQCERVKKNRRNEKFLPGVEIPKEIAFASNLPEVLGGAEYVVFVVPSQTLRGVARQVAVIHPKKPVIVCATKGIENGSLMRMSEVLKDELPQGLGKRVAVLVGPSHAEEVARKIPTTVVASSTDEKIAADVQTLFMGASFRVYTNSDMVGVELGVSLKNIIAIAAGICDGLGYGDNTKGALLTRGLAEIARLGVTLGAKRETFAGLAGVGDLVTTCISRHSRNRHVGEEIAKGKTLERITSEMVMVAEGVPTTKAAVDLAKRHKVDMPIAQEVYNVLFERKPPREAIRQLMMREPKPEVW
ncbi:MAG: NAD(P)H-dependent glycerol-3-phosphate dehydrogenase [Candidatus Eisenbacteria bacterium]|nr:NAD(P)H-dependent glycerol-3-phosphate dehydrogenase [Candidatus Eisenbacteria bacterium]